MPNYKVRLNRVPTGGMVRLADQVVEVTAKTPDAAVRIAKRRAGGGRKAKVWEVDSRWKPIPK